MSSPEEARQVAAPVAWKITQKGGQTLRWLTFSANEAPAALGGCIVTPLYEHPAPTGHDDGAAVALREASLPAVHEDYDSGATVMNARKALRALDAAGWALVRKGGAA